MRECEENLEPELFVINKKIPWLKFHKSEKKMQKTQNNRLAFSRLMKFFYLFFYFSKKKRESFVMIVIN